MIESNYVWQVGEFQDINTYNNMFHPVVLQLLKNRGIETTEEINRFINPTLDLLYNPLLLKDMAKAVKRINTAINKRHKITIYGDYDVDGITSCCILVKLLRKMGADVNYYIPSRQHEGYGLNLEAVKKISNEGTRLIITVDNGIGSYEEVELAKSLGMDVIITDHHEPQEMLPNAYAIIDPKQNDCNYPFKNLAGVGVALKLAHALTDMNPDTIKEYLDLATLGTVADMVPILDENRIIVKNGLNFLNNTKNKGLNAIYSKLNIKDTQLDTGKISFILAPRLNAVGRISDAAIAVELLLTEDDVHAAELAETLENVNKERQAIETKIFNEARAIIDQNFDLNKERVLVVSSPDWNPGVIGIVASKLVELYSRPCILIAEEGKEGRGSGRSISSFNLFEALTRVSHLLKRYGGHEQAAGILIDVNNIRDLRAEINQLANDLITDDDLNRKLDIDVELKEKDINLELARQLELLEPFGFGNPKPTFMCRDFSIQRLRTVGRGNKHLKMSLKKRKGPISAIGFNFGPYKEDLDLAPYVDMAFHLEVNRWQGCVQHQLNIKDLKVPYLEDDLLYSIESRYYDFFKNVNSEFMQTYNKDISSVINHKSLIFKGMNGNDKKEYVYKLLKDKSRNVFVIFNTPYKAWQFISFINEEPTLTNNTSVLYNDNVTVETVHEKNIFMINPMAGYIPKFIDDVVLYDTAFSIDILKKQLDSICSKSVHLIFTKEDLHSNYLVWKKLMPDINDLRRIFILLSKMTSGKFIGRINIDEFDKLLKDFMNLNLSRVGIHNIMEIFSELGLIKYNIKDGYINITDYNKSEKKLDIKTSYTYKSMILLLDKILDFKDKLKTLEKTFNHLVEVN